MIKLEKIRKLIGTFYLRDISLEIPEGYIIGLVGANGCGKTSLLHVLMGLYKPDSGSMERHLTFGKRSERLGGFGTTAG